MNKSAKPCQASFKFECHKSFLNSYKIFLIGIVMGAADIVPGISGGTIAFISGIYNKLIGSLSNLDFKALSYLYKRQFARFCDHINLGFLIKLGLGICTSLFSMVHLITYLLAYHPIILWSLFLGFILASAWVIAKHIDRWNLKQFLFLILGFIAGWFATSTIDLGIEPNLLNFFLGGAIAICAMLLPGISGSFLLVVMGLYQPMILALKNLHFIILFVFISGCLLGLVFFSKFINWLLKHYAQVTKAFLIGLTLGALRKVWPWQVPLASFTSETGNMNHDLLVNVLPSTFTAMTGKTAHIGLVCALFMIGFVSVLLLEYLTKRLDAKS